MDGVRAECEVSVRLGGIEALVRLEPLPLGLDKRDKAHGNAAYLRNQLGSFIEHSCEE